MVFGETHLFLPEGAVPTIIDNKYHPSHVATDFHHHYKEDIALVGEMGFKIFRLSINYVRIFPNGDDETPNEEEIKIYDDYRIDYLRQNIQSMDDAINKDGVDRDDEGKRSLARYKKDSFYWLKKSLLLMEVI